MGDHRSDCLDRIRSDRIVMIKREDQSKVSLDNEWSKPKIEGVTDYGINQRSFTLINGRITDRIANLFSGFVVTFLFIGVCL